MGKSFVPMLSLAIPLLRICCSQLGWLISEDCPALLNLCRRNTRPTQERGFITATGHRKNGAGHRVSFVEGEGFEIASKNYGVSGNEETGMFEEESSAGEAGEE